MRRLPARAATWESPSRRFASSVKSLSRQIAPLIFSWPLRIGHLGVTISPIRKGQEKINGAICLLSDLTELAALQQQMQLKENLAALGELSAGIAHEFKNALATISGYAQMIRGEELGGEASDYADKILEQTRSITHGGMEILKYARPLDIGNEPIAVEGRVEREGMEVA